MEAATFVFALVSPAAKGAVFTPISIHASPNIILIHHLFKNV